MSDEMFVIQSNEPFEYETTAMSNTPITDAIVAPYFGDMSDNNIKERDELLDHARTFERELAAVIAERDRIRSQLDIKRTSSQIEGLNKQNKHLVSERDSLLAVVEKMREVIDKNHKWHQTYDEHDGYADSELCDVNVSTLSLTPTAALAAFQSREKEPKERQKSHTI